jgi:ATP-binding cassette subfamily B protein
VDFKDVSFAYGEKEVLHNISFRLKRNHMLALVGPSGGGKSTVANLLARFWDVKSVRCWCGERMYEAYRSLNL